MKLITLQIRNFKGIRELDLKPDGADMNVFGANAVGKTTIADAYLWLLFGKSLDGKSDFEIFPIGAPDGTEPSVDAEFERMDGRRFKLRRAIKKNFVRKEGESQAEYKGNTREFYIDDVPKKDGEFKDFIASLGGEEQIMMLSDPDRFPGKMKWQDRRKMLLETFAMNMSEKDIILRHPELAELGEHVGAMYSVQDVADRMKAQRKKVNAELKQLPGRIDERMRDRPKIPDDAEVLPMAKLAKDRMEALSKIEDIRNGSTVSVAKALVANRESQIAEAKAEYIKTSAGGSDNLEAQCMELRRNILNSKDRIFTLQQDIEAYTNQITVTKEEREALVNQYKKVRAQNFEGSECPTCHRPYDPEKLEECKAAFNLGKAEKIKQINDQGNELTGIIVELKGKVEKMKKDLQAEEARLPEVQKHLEQLQADIVTPPPFEQTVTYQELAAKLSEAEKNLETIQSTSTAQIAKYERVVVDIDVKLGMAQKIAAAKELAEQNEARIKELMALEKKLGFELAKLDNILLLCEKFTQLQAGDFEEMINSHFRMVKWKLFDRQINGGIVPICEATVDGVGYNNTLNTAARMNAGLDIINAFAATLGESWPLFIDNAESVTKYLRMDSQVIRLYVSAKDRDMRVEMKIREGKAA